MFIKNYSDTDLVINYKGNEKTLGKRDVTYIDDRWISLAMVKAMFGNWVEQVTPTVPIEEFMFDNQIALELDKVYLTVTKGPGAPRMFIKEGKVDIYFADGKEIPADESDMSLFTNYTEVEGLLMLDVMPKWMLVKAHTSGETPEVVATNIEVKGE